MGRLLIAESLRPVLALSPRAAFAGRLALLGEDVIPRRFRPREHLLREGSQPTPGIFLILSGFAAGYLTLSAGRRQITALLLPGDLCGSRACFGARLEHSIGALSTVVAAFIPSDGFLTRAANSADLLRSLWEIAARDEAIARQWLLNLGRRSAVERTAHLLCEIFTRLRNVGLAEHNSFRLPITQSDLADALALTAVHVNRTLMELRRLNLISLERQHLVIHDVEGLRSVAGFNPAYLGDADSAHLQRSPVTASILLPSGSNTNAP